MILGIISITLIGSLSVLNKGLQEIGKFQQIQLNQAAALNVIESINIKNYKIDQSVLDNFFASRSIFLGVISTGQGIEFTILDFDSEQTCSDKIELTSGNSSCSIIELIGYDNLRKILEVNIYSYSYSQKYNEGEKYFYKIFL